MGKAENAKLPTRHTAAHGDTTAASATPAQTPFLAGWAVVPRPVREDVEVR